MLVNEDNSLVARADCSAGDASPTPPPARKPGNPAAAAAGFLVAGPERNGNCAFRGEIIVMYVLRAYQRRGAGRLLFQTARERLQTVGATPLLVWVPADNPYRAVYGSMGGVRVDAKVFDFGGYKASMVAYGWS